MNSCNRIHIFQVRITQNNKVSNMEEQFQYNHTDSVGFI